MIAVVLDTNTTYLVTRDQDLLTLGKPFGIQMITPMAFLGWLRSS